MGVGKSQFDIAVCPRFPSVYRPMDPIDPEVMRYGFDIHFFKKERIRRIPKSEWIAEKMRVCKKHRGEMQWKNTQPSKFKFYLFCHPVDVVIQQWDRIAEPQLQEECEVYLFWMCWCQSLWTKYRVHSGTLIIAIENPYFFKVIIPSKFDGFSITLGEFTGG